jgi:hypothetical protein
MSYVIRLRMESNGKGVSIDGVKFSFEALVKSILVNLELMGNTTSTN